MIHKNVLAKKRLKLSVNKNKIKHTKQNKIKHTTVIIKNLKGKGKTNKNMLEHYNNNKR